jgi:hypothetical protein
MSSKGAPLRTLLRRLAETPPEILAAPRERDCNGIHVDAVVADTLALLGIEDPPVDVLNAFSVTAPTPHRRLALLGCWLLADPWFSGRAELADAAANWLRHDLAITAELLDPQRVVADDDRREEFARLALQAFGLLPEGENVAQAEDRLRTLDTAERRGLMRGMRERIAHARALRIKMAEKAALEAAARAGREW